MKKIHISSLTLFSVMTIVINLFSLGDVQRQKKKAVSITHFFSVSSHFKIGIGILVKNRPKGYLNPSEYALDDGYIYEGAAYRFNKTNIVQYTKTDISHLVGKVVIIFYRPEKDLNKILKKKGPTPAEYGRKESMVQLRSDWVSDETGFTIGRSTKKRLKKIEYYEVKSIELYPGFSVEKGEKKTKIEFTNYFDSPITNLKIGGHYESGLGKPIPEYRTEKFKQLDSGKSLKVTFHNTLGHKDERDKNNFYTIHSVIISGKIGSHSFNFDYLIN